MVSGGNCSNNYGKLQYTAVPRATMRYLMSAVLATDPPDSSRIAPLVCVDLQEIQPVLA